MRNAKCSALNHRIPGRKSQLRCCISQRRSPVHVERCDAVPEEVLRGPERQTQDATVPSLRADTVLAAMMRTSRSIAAQAIQSGRVEVNHVPLRTAHEDVFEGDIFTVRGVGRYRLVAIGGKSRKDRLFISFYQY